MNTLVLAALQTAEQPMTATEIAKMLGENRGNVHKSISVLLGTGSIRRVATLRTGPTNQPTILYAATMEE